MKLIKKVLSTVTALALASSAFVTMQASAEDVAYINFLNTDGSWGDSTQPNCLSAYGTREKVNDGDEHGDYTKLTKVADETVPIPFVYVCEGTENGIPELFVKNVAAGRILTVEADFIPDENTQYVYLQTYYSIAMTYKLDITTLPEGVLKVGEWNHIKIVANVGMLSQTNAGKTPNRVYSSYYINGCQVTSFSDIGEWPTLAAMQGFIDAGTVNKQFVRLKFDAKEGSESFTVAYDNVSYKTSDGGDVFDSNMENSVFSPAILKDASSSFQTGLAGRADTDTSFVFTPSVETGYFEIRVPTDAKYIKTEYDILPDESLTSVRTICRNQDLTYNMFQYIDATNTSNQWLKHDRWNHISVISSIDSLDLDTGAATVTSTGYANGYKVCTATKTYTPGTDAAYREFTNGTDDGYGTGRTYMPFRLGNGLPANSNTCYDNIKITTSNEEPAQNAFGKVTGANILVNSSTRYEDGVISITAGKTVTAADLSITDGSVRAYTDNSMSDELPATEPLTTGNFVTATDANGAVLYYEIGEPRQPETKVLASVNFDDDCEETNKSYSGTTGAVSAAKGNYEIVCDQAARADQSLLISTPSNATDFFLSTPDVSTAIQYTKLDFNVLPMGDEFKMFRVGTYQNAGVTTDDLAYSSKFVKNRWNHITLLIDNENFGDVSGTNVDVPVSVKMYLNGELYADTTGALRVTNSVTHFRLIGWGTAASADASLAFDDVTLIQSEEAQVAPTFPAVTLNAGTIKDSTMTINEGATPADITVDGGIVAVYTDDTFSDTLGTTDAMSAGDVVVVSDTTGTLLKYYDVAVAEFEIVSAKLSVDGATASTSSLDLGTYDYDVKVVNPTLEAKAVNPVIAVYDANGRLVNVAYTKGTIAAGTNATVKAELTLESVDEGSYIKTFIWDDNMNPYDLGPVKVLIIGNSITKHGASESLGWNGTWGMAATSEDKDYVHLLKAEMEEKFGTDNVEFMWGNFSEFEKYFYDWSKFSTGNYTNYVDFDADVIICSLGANVKNSSNEQDKTYENEYTFTAQNYKDIIGHFNADGEAIVICGQRLLTSNADVITAINTAITDEGWATIDVGTNIPGVTAEEKTAGIECGTFTEEVSAGVLGHPGNSGMAEIASRISPVLTTAIESLN